MRHRKLTSAIVLACLCLALNAAGLFGQILTPILGNLNPCPGTESYRLFTNTLLCSTTEYEVTVTPVDINGNEVTLGYEIGVPNVTAYAAQDSIVGGMGTFAARGYFFTVTWAVPPSRQFRWARICFRARCYEMTPGGTLDGPEWYSRCVTVEIKTIDPVTVTGPKQFECCSTEPLTFCATPNNYSSYEWTIPSGWTVQGPSNQSCITVIPNGAGGTVTAKPYHSECNKWGPPTFYSVTSTVCTRATIDVLQLVPCDGSPRGSIKANAPSGFSISDITWRDGTGTIVNQGQTTLTGLAPGIYKAEITLNNGCTALASVELTDPENDSPLDLSFTASLFDASSWEGAPDCMYYIQAFPSGGVPPYDFYWTGFPHNDNMYVNAQGPRTVTLTITDARGCTYTESYSIPRCFETPDNDVISKLTASPNPNNGLFSVDVDATNSGVLDLKVFNTMNAVVYTDNVGLISSGTHQYQVDISSQPNGTYFLTATLNGTNPMVVQIIKQ